MKKRPLLIVEWDDISTHRAYSDEKEAGQFEPVKAVSVGWRLKGKRGYLALTPMRFNNGECGDRQVIPNGCITSIRKVE